jgi:hypothetical protein
MARFLPLETSLRERGAAFPGKDGGEAKNFSKTQRPEDLQKGSQSR